MMEIINYIISCVKYTLNILIFQHIFKYPEKWHNYPYNHKPYAMDIVNTINKKLEETYGIKIFDETKSIVEVGCGRGDIIGRLKKPCKEKLGLDLDSNILRMGGYFHKDIIFRKGTFFDIEEDEISALIMVNFITNISPESLKEYLDAVRKKNKVDVVVFDTYEKDPSIRAYHFVHDGNFILPGFRLLHKSKGFSTASGAVRYVEYWISEDDV